MKTEEKQILETVAVHDIERYYSGKANRCHCGCTGKYTSNENPRNVWRFVKMLALFKNADFNDVKFYSNQISNGQIEISFHTTVGNKDYAIWLKPRPA